LLGPESRHQQQQQPTASHKQFQLPLHIRNTQLTLFNKDLTKYAQQQLQPGNSSNSNNNNNNNNNNAFITL